MNGAVFPLCCLTWGQTVVEVLEIMVTSFKMSSASTAALSVPDPIAGHCWHTPLPETPGHPCTSLGQSLEGSLLLFPASWCTQSFVCALQESVSPVLCKFWQLYGGVNGDLLQEGYAIPRSTASRVHAPAASHGWPVPPQETLRHSTAGLAQSLCYPGVHRVLFELSEHLWPLWSLIVNAVLPPLPSWWDFFFILGRGISFFVCGIQHFMLMVVQQQVIILELLQEKISTCPTTLPSWPHHKLK